MTDNMAEQARMAWMRMFEELSTYKARELCERVETSAKESHVELMKGCVAWQLSMIEEYRFLFGASYRCEIEEPKANFGDVMAAARKVIAAVPEPEWTEADEQARLAEQRERAGIAVARVVEQERMKGRSILREVPNE